MIKELIKKIHYDPFSGYLYWLPNTRGWKLAKTKGKYLAVCGHKTPYGYVHIHNYRAHRVAWFIFYGELLPKKIEIDHINGNRSDNRISNLRKVTRHENALNQEVHRNGLIIGTHFNKRQNRWSAKTPKKYLNHKGNQIFLGYFDTMEEAGMAVVEFCSNPYKLENKC